jgi:hypothetical protein
VKIELREAKKKETMKCKVVISFDDEYKKHLELKQNSIEVVSLSNMSMGCSMKERAVYVYPTKNPSP